MTSVDDGISSTARLGVPKEYAGEGAPNSFVLGVVACAIVSVLAGITMIGWLAGIPELVRLSPGTTSMQFNTSVCFLLVSLSLLTLSRGYKLLAGILAIIVITIAAAVGSQDVSGWNLGIDTLFVDPFITDDSAHPGRMAPNTAAAFILFAAAVASTALRSDEKRRFDAVPILFGFMFGYSLFVLVGYAGSIETTYKWEEHISMAVQTAIGFAVLSVGALAFNWSENDDVASRRVFPSWLAATVAFALAAIAAGGTHAISKTEEQSRISELHVAAEGMRAAILNSVDRRVSAFNRLGGRIERLGADAVAIRTEVETYHDDQDDLVHAIVETESGTVVPALSFSLNENAGLERSLVSALNALIAAKGYSGSPLLGVLPATDRNPELLAVWRSIQAPDDTEVSKIIFLYDVKEMLSYLNALADALGYDYAISIDGNDLAGVLLTLTGIEKGHIDSESTILHGANWKVSVWHEANEDAVSTISLPVTVFGIGMLTAFLGFASVSYHRKSQLQEFASETLNRTLEEEISTRKQSEQDLANLKNRLELILSSAGEGIYGLDLEGFTTFANKAAERLTGWTVEEMSDHKQHDLIHHSYADGSEYPQQDCTIYKTLKDGTVHSAEGEVFWRKDGTCFPVEFVTSPIINHEGRLEGAVVVFRDVTLRKQQEEEVRITNMELAATNSELEAFCYSVSHDLRAPLRAIGGFSAVLAEDYAGNLDEEGRVCLDRIQKAVDRMGNLIDDLLTLSRLTRQETRMGVVDLTALAQSAVEDLQSGDPKRSVEVVIADGCKVWADSRLMTAVLQNLIGNAWKFTRDRTDGRIEFGPAEPHEDGRKRFFVRDNGAGFDMAHARKLFMPFQRLHSQREFEGSGVGLATVQRAIHRHSGRVWAESEPGKGACFYFEL